MTTYDNAYSRWVAWLKVLLPMGALAILSTLFLMSQQRDPDAAIPYSDAEVAEILREQKIAQPDYAGVTRDGTSISLTADSARPDGAGQFSTAALRGSIETPDGGRLNLEAAEGTIDNGAQIARMTGGVRIQTSTGYTIQTTGLEAALDAASVITDGPITADGPPGQLRAGRMELRQDGVGGKSTYVLVFTEGVDLLYQPQPSQGGRE